MIVSKTFSTVPPLPSAIKLLAYDIFHSNGAKKGQSIHVMGGPLQASHCGVLKHADLKCAVFQLLPNLNLPILPCVSPFALHMEAPLLRHGEDAATAGRNL
ncbi:hypothetical protein HZ326_18584 [Fusarium oxysporum f. sp. albedinis]|nr:hypothetical protein HZ326_18584 [Fusarium oxysporum f. sp. albedinis]